jgi:periplasmic divalent cation tolerance protein
MGFIFIYVTNPDKKTARKVALYLLKKRLVACVNFFPIESAYWWKSKIERTKEYVLIMKTLEKNFEKVKKEIKKIHPYTTPCIIKINVEANEEYDKWLKEEVI